tara:strand:+ start:570 stop:1544 length:975 start_codon:yes stop_codon:yes gene_type:complete
MPTIKHSILVTALLLLSSNLAAQSRPSVSGNAASISALESEVQSIKNEVASIELTPGPKGDKGDTGAQGAKGVKGDQGPAGPAGPAGLDGINGIDGAPGADGQDGIGAIVGTDDYQMQYWLGGQWQTIAPPNMATADAQVLTFVNGALSWEVAGNLIEPTTYAIGDTGPAGGIVFYVSEDGLHGLEAAPTDADLSGDATLEWGCSGQSVAGANGTGIGSGLQNTLDILAHTCSITPNYGGPVHQAALAARSYSFNGYSDWFLPSKDELNALYQNRAVVGGFANDFYWSSSQYDSYYAWNQYFANGFQNYYNKFNTMRVRAVRAF